MKTKSRNKKYNYIDNYFQTIDTEDKAYFLGLMFADGNIINNGFEIALSGEDRYIIEEFRNRVAPESPIKIKKTYRQDSHRFGVYSSPQLKNNLISLGCIPHKSKILKFPDINKINSSFNPSFY